MIALANEITQGKMPRRGSETLLVLALANTVGHLAALLREHGTVL